VLAEDVRLLAGYRRPGLVDEAALEHAVVRVVDGEPLGVSDRSLTGNGPVWGVRPALLAPSWGPAEVLVRASRLSLLRAHRGSPFGWDRCSAVIAAGAVSGGHLIPVTCRPACAMRSISGVADRPKRGPSRLLLAACGVRA
jgi:hypothetical protein